MTRASRLAIEALVELADVGRQEWVTAEALSGSTTGDLPFVKQVLHRLAGAGIVRSKLGRGGGYQLARNPRTLTLKMVVDTIDGGGLERCMLDSTLCDGRRRCRMAPTWHPMRDQLLGFLEQETIQSIAERSRGAVERFALSEMDRE